MKTACLERSICPLNQPTIQFHPYFEWYRPKFLIPVSILTFPMTHMRFSIHLDVARTNWNWFELYNALKSRYLTRVWKQANANLSITRLILIARLKAWVLQQRNVFSMPLRHQHRQGITTVDHHHGLYHRLFHAGKITCQDQELSDYRSDRGADWCKLNNIHGITWMVRLARSFTIILIEVGSLSPNRQNEFLSGTVFERGTVLVRHWVSLCPFVGPFASSTLSLSVVCGDLTCCLCIFRRFFVNHSLYLGCISENSPVSNTLRATHLVFESPNFAVRLPLLLLCFIHHYC